MDYPLSKAAEFALHNGKFDDGVPGVREPSVIPSETMNALVDELLGVITAAGLTPNEDDLSQLLNALRSPGVFQTAPQFDVSTKPATMEAVQRALGNAQNTSILTVASTLTAADAGKLMVLTGAGAFTTTLPLLSTLPVGAAFRFVCTGSTGTRTVACQGANQIDNGGTPITSFVLSAGDTLELINGGAYWYAVGGSVALKYAGNSGFNFSQNGYQKLPSGLIMQWGKNTAAANSTTTITLPISFTTAFIGVSVTVQDHTGIVTSYPFSAGVPINNSSFYLRSYYSASNINNFWLAIGY